MRTPTRVITMWLLAAVTASPARAQQVAPAVPAWTADATGAFLSEAWDYNLSREELRGGSLEVRRRAARSWAFGGEILMMSVRQRGDDGWLAGGGPSVRWTANPAARARVFVDVGLGLSRASVRVPPRGTRVNYLVRTSGGLSRTLSSRTAATIALTWLHLSNASLEGRDRNPDIQAVGVTIGVSRVF